jgi:hypothetical protein
MMRMARQAGDWARIQGYVVNNGQELDKHDLTALRSASPPRPRRRAD